MSPQKPPVELGGKSDIHVAITAENAPARGGAHLVAAGILMSRIMGLVRERVFAHYFGTSDAGDAFKAAFKIPNFLQNLFGEGVLSASFIPVYSGLIAQGKKDEAARVASVIAAFMTLIVSILVVGGVFATPFLIDVIAPGFNGEKRDLTIRLVQIFFPATGLLVMSAWCLGVLNSHRRFLLSYSAPVMSNIAMIAGLLAFGKRDLSELAIIGAWTQVIGSALQLLVQIPTALKLVGHFRPAFSLALSSVRSVLRNFVPVVLSRGVVQITAYIDNMLASLLPTGAVSGLAYAQLIYLLPVSVFGMSISAAELPAMSSIAVDSQEKVAEVLQKKLNASLRQMAFFIVPSAMAFLALGDTIVAAIYQSGAFNRTTTLTVWGVLAGASVGLLAACLGRLYSSAYYALQDTRSPLKFALVRVVLTTVLGYIFALKFPVWFGVPVSWGTAGLTSSAGIAAWIEFLLLRRGLNRRIGNTGLDRKYLAKLWCAAIAGAIVAYAIKIFFAGRFPVIAAVAVFFPYGLIYVGVTLAFNLPEAHNAFGRFRRFFPKRI